MMAGSASNDCGAGRSVDSMSEWRSSEQMESGTPSTSPPYWDTDDEDDCGLKPSDLYGKFTWKIENFSQITKRELRSNDFEVGGYKWYILIYPQGCDVCNHLSLFLCVANHDKLLPGWSHFAQFTIAVVNLDPKKSKYSDTLHRFWKKEHDWGWKKFMELSKVLDGFIVKDTLIIKAQVQVIREKADRPFRCLDCQYRRELVRVYLSNVEQICRRFLEERRSKLIRLIEDKIRWSSFCSFWLGIDQKARHCMSSDKSDVILKVIVKHFFIEKEVTSTLVMDSLYSGLKALENQSRNQKFVKLLEAEEIPAPIIHLNNDMFVLADDVLVLLERASVEPLPPKDDKGPQNRTKDGNSGENTNRDSIERDERRLTELGRRTVETFVLAHIFSNKIEVAYQEAVALKRQEELIREEEVAGQAESVLKAKRAIAEKEKKAKKKQAKQKRYNRKGKDKRKDEKSNLVLQEKHQRKDEPTQRIFDEFAVKKTLSVLKKAESLEDTSDVSDIGDDPTLSNFEERDPFPVLSDTDASVVNPSVELGGLEMSHLPGLNNPTNKNTSIPEDSCSTCSTDSIPSISTNGVHSENLLPSNEDQTSSYCWGRNKHSQVAHGLTGSDVEDRFNANHSHAAANRCKIGSTTGVIGFPLSLKDQMKGLEQDAVEKQEIMSLEKKLILDESDKKGQPSEQRIADGSPSLVNHQPKQPSNQRPKQPTSKPISSKETSPIGSQKSIPKERSLRTPSIEKPYLQQLAAPSKSKHPAATKNLLQLPLTERSSAPLAIIPKPIAPVISSSTPSALKLSKPVCEVGVYPSSINHEYVPQSYRNVIMGQTSGLGLNFSPSFSSSTSDHLLFHCQDSFLDTISVRPELQHNVHQWIDCPTNEMNSSLVTFDSATDPQIACKVPGTSQDETFPHLDIINDLLNDGHCLSQDIEAILDKSNSSPLTLMDMGQGSPYKDEVHSIYGFSEQFHQLRDFAPQMMSSIYMTDQIGDVVSNQWILGGADLSLYNTGNLNHDKYQIFPQEYTNVACGVNGYPTLWGSSGH